jgi:hypothetical protein
MAAVSIGSVSRRPSINAANVAATRKQVRRLTPAQRHSPLLTSCRIMCASLGVCLWLSTTGGGGGGHCREQVSVIQPRHGQTGEGEERMGRCAAIELWAHCRRCFVLVFVCAQGPRSRKASPSVVSFVGLSSTCVAPPSSLRARRHGCVVLCVSFSFFFPPSLPLQFCMCVFAFHKPCIAFLRLSFSRLEQRVLAPGGCAGVRRAAIARPSSSSALPCSGCSAVAPLFVFPL